MGVIMSSSSGPDDEVAPPRVEDITATSAGGVGVPRDTAEASTSVPDAVSPFDNFYDSQTVNTATADNIYIPEWGVTNGARVDNPALCRNLLDHITPHAYRTRLERAKREAVEVGSLRGRVSKMEAEVAVKSQEVETLGKQNAELLSKKEVVGKAKLREEFKSFQDAEARCFEQKSTELESRIADVRRDMDNDLYPYMFIVIAERRQILSHSVHLAIMKYAQSNECRSALGKVTVLIYSEPGSISGKIFLSEVVLTARAAAERKGLCPPSLGVTFSSDP
uniref:Transposase (Putative), gypsy type n=1 Tax=Tanacetum cinerariifolium TaxID=118510 RepID=A0A6L2NN85_TANCI|nr:hypothetical protein [Tanacetum cinerariifolium]